MRVVFMGTPGFAAQALSELVGAGHEIAAVYTQPPRPRGRGQRLQPSAVGALAEEYGLDVRVPATMKAPAEAAALRELQADVGVVVAYGQILPQAVLDAPREGCLNLHASLLPRWRGAAPIQRAIMAGDEVTGVQVMRMEAGLDTGPILLSETVRIAEDDTFATLHDKLAGVGANLLPRALAALSRGGLEETAQGEEGVTYARKITPAETRIDWQRPAAQIDRHIRGLSPFPGAHSELGSTRIKLLLSCVGEPSDRPLGSARQTEDDRIAVTCGDGREVLVSELQRSGKKAQSTAEYLRGAPLPLGSVFS